jgi:hypothetical protein
MPKTNESMNSNLYELLQSQGFNVTLLSSSGQQVPVPQEAEVFQFEFVDDDRNRGTVTLTIDGLYKLIVYYNNEIFGAGHQSESWIKFVKLIKKFAQRNQLGFQLSNLDKLHRLRGWFLECVTHQGQSRRHQVRHDGRRSRL